MLDPIPAPIASLLALFEGALASVKFPDVDSAVLASAVAQSRASAEAVANAEAALDRARTAFQESHDALLVRAQRALAYARVYAEGDEALLAQLEAITLPRAPRRATRDVETLAAPEQPVRRRARARKDDESGLLLESQASADA